MRKGVLAVITSCLLQFGWVNAKAQGNVWNAATFKFSVDNILFEPLTDGVTLNIPATGIRATDTISFPGDFSFRFGLTGSRSFSASANGYIKLGGKPLNLNPVGEPGIIAPFLTFGSTFSCQYKLTGVAPNRKMVMEWSGNYVGTFQNVRFQLWLHEHTGRIEFIYQGTAFSFNANYQAFCRAGVLGQNALASVNVLAGGNATVNYSSTSVNTAALPAGTRFVFEPDTLRPLPPVINFNNVLPGCYTVNIKDSSVNESRFILEKWDGISSYVSIQSPYSINVQGTGNLYPYNETNMKPDSLYLYRAFSTNGFQVSDTLYASLRTPMPLINGLQRIPGDYNSVNDLLNDALCKHLGPELVIELQPGYTAATEPNTIRFVPQLHHRHLQSVTIRPAPSVVGLFIDHTADRPYLFVDSVPYVHIDGRAGGVGAGVMAIRQTTNQLQPLIVYVNNANGGSVKHLNLQGQLKNTTTGLVLVGNRGPQRSYPNAVHQMEISHCRFGPAVANTVCYQLLTLEGGSDNLVRNNEFYRFFISAITWKNGGKGSRVTRNRLYQPEFMSHVDGMNAANSPGAIVCTGMGNGFVADSNRLGGSSPAWPGGTWSQNIGSGSQRFGIINVTAAEKQQVVISGNEVGGINITGNKGLALIYARGNSIIAGNRIGIPDSLKSIRSVAFQSGLFTEYAGKVTVSGNVVSGLYSSEGSGDLYRAFNIDTVVAQDNDLGGADAYNTNVFFQQAHCIELGSVRNAYIRRNNCRGITSLNSSAIGISQEYRYLTEFHRAAFIDSNRIHHIQGRRATMGIFQRLSRTRKSNIGYNRIYALYGIGPVDNVPGDGAVFTAGIKIETFGDMPEMAGADTSFLLCSGNRIWAFRNPDPGNALGYPVIGLEAEGVRTKVHNNTINLGLNSSGQPFGLPGLGLTGIVIWGEEDWSEIEHNSIYLNNSGDGSCRGINLKWSQTQQSMKSVFITNNIIHIDRTGAGTNGQIGYMPFESPYQRVVANRNMWYSNDDPQINSKLQQWISNCRCDSLSFTGNPQWVNIAGDSATQDMHVLPGSVADGAGIPPVGQVPEDMDREMRAAFTPHDIGADASTPCVQTTSASLDIQPASDLVEICAGGTLQLTATMSGTVQQLQWQKNLQALPGANNLQYTVSAPGTYRITGTTTCGTIASKTIQVVEGVSNPAVKLYATGVNPVCEGGSAVFSIEYSKNSLYPTGIMWFRNGIPVPGANADTLSISDLQFFDEISVRVTDSTPCGLISVTKGLTIDNVYPSIRPSITIHSYRDTLYSAFNVDTLRYRVTPAGIPADVLYLTPVVSPLHSRVGDSLIIFTNLPYTIQFKLVVPDPQNQFCFFPDTSAVQTITVDRSADKVQYIFTGDGNWTVPSNWISYQVPPAILPFNQEIIIAPQTGGRCLLNINQVISSGARMVVAPGANLLIQGELRQQ